MPLEKKKASRIIISKTANISNEKKWEEYFEWLSQTSQKLREAIDTPLKECLKEINGR